MRIRTSDRTYSVGEVARLAHVSVRAMDAAERHRRLIDRWFYPCPPAMHVALGQMCVANAARPVSGLSRPAPSRP